MFDQPFVRDCPLQKIDPRMRLGVAILLSLFLAYSHNLKAILFSFLFALACLLMALIGPKVPIASLFKRLLAVNTFILLLWLTTPWTTKGTPFYALGPFVLTHEGLFLSAIVTLKANALTFVFIAFLATLDISSLTFALRFFKCPQKLVLLFIMGLRNIYVLADEWERLMTAAKLRGFVPKTSLHAFKTLASLLAILLLRSFDRAKRVREAMLLRHFKGYFVLPQKQAFQAMDVFFASLVLFLFAFLCVLEIGLL